MKKSKQSKATKIALQKGYFIDEKGVVFNPKDEKLDGFIGAGGYRRFTIRTKKFDIENINIWFHRLQGLQKFGNIIFKDGVEVRHLDNDKKNNSWNNIAIGSHSENMLDLKKEDRKKCAKNAGREKSPSTPEEIKEIRKRVKNNNYESYSQLATEYGYASKSSISQIVNKKVWTLK